jgi:hypothetical protein
MQGAEIHWGDESGLRSHDVRGRSYSPTGQAPVVCVNNKRQGLSVISTEINKGQMRWKIFEGGLNANILIDFMRRLVHGASKKIFLILDKTCACATPSRSSRPSWVRTNSTSRCSTCSATVPNGP